MNRILSMVAMLVFLFSSCTITNKDIVTQTSTIDALLAGVYDGEMTCRELLEHGDFGIGTFDQLDGEMIILEGNIYQVKSDGKVYLPDPEVKTPFATICQFETDRTVSVALDSDYEAVKKLIDTHAPNQNLFCAIKITGQFKSIKTRSVPAQSKPYPPLKEVTANQPEFLMNEISGMIVGFRCPEYVKGINVPGYHLHFISSDHKQGGHVLSFETINSECELDILNKFFLTLPSGAKEFANVDLSKDRSKELRVVEE